MEKTLYAFMSNEPKEGIVSIETSKGSMPFIMINLELAEASIPYMEAIAAQHHKDISLVEFKMERIIKEIKGSGNLH